jgi:hypothetical protein
VPIRVVLRNIQMDGIGEQILFAEKEMNVRIKNVGSNTKKTPFSFPFVFGVDI